MLSEADLRFLLEHRQGGHCTAPYGTTYPHGHHAPVPPVRPREGHTVSLALPKPGRLATALGKAILSRSTVRKRGTLTLQAVSTLLGHTMRILDVREGQPYASVFKPVPSGGAMHPLEGYLFASDMLDLAPGVWRYAAREHALDKVAPMDARAYGVLMDAALSMGTHATVDGAPPAVLVLAARWGRTAWKYERIPLAAVLKDVGVLYGAMSLVGPQCGAGVCPLGGGDMEMFQMVTGLDPLVEASVGELALWGA